MDTSSGLSSIASLSLGFTMSMRSLPPAKSAAGGAVPHGLPPSSSSSSSETASRSQSTRSNSARLLRQQTIEETPRQLRRTGTWCADQQHQSKEEEHKPRGCNATQSFHMKRINEEHAELTTGPRRSMGVAGTVGATKTTGPAGVTSVNKCLSNVSADGNGVKKAGNCSMVKSTVPVVPLEQSKDFNLETKPSRLIENNSDQDHETSAKLPNTGLRPELASDPRDHRSDLEPEAFQPSGVDSETERFKSEPRFKDPGNSSKQVNKHPSSQPPPQCNRSIDGAVRWFRWRSTGSSHCCCSSSCSCSSAQTIDKATPAQKDLTSPHLLRQMTYASTSMASNRRSAWRNTFHRKKNVS